MSYGIIRKLGQQAKALQAVNGVEADLILVMPKDYFATIPSIQGLIPVQITIPRHFGLCKWFFSWWIWHRLSELLARYDAVVIRWTVPSPPFLREVCRRSFFSEHHSKEIDELRLRGGIQNRLLEILEQQYSPRILAATQGIIGVTDEIRLYELARSSSQRPSIVLPNGIDPEDVTFTPAQAYTGGTLQVAFVASHFAPWHGLDRLLNGMRIWKSQSQHLTLHLIGRVTHAQVSAIESMGLSEQIRIHGILYGNALDKILAYCHIAIGSLAIHRKGLTQACPLKAREYTARGLPFVIAYDDPDLPTGLPWVLRVPSDDSAVSIKDLVAFATETGQNHSLGEKMRAYSETHLSWRIKIEDLIKFIHTYAG